jgi:hypothetical protein
MKQYANYHGYSDAYPYEVVKVVSDKTVEVRAMDSELDPNWKPETIPGGYAGHTVNNFSQEWIITSNPEHPVIRIRKHKNGQWYSKHKQRFVFSDVPVRHYDYNF